MVSCLLCCSRMVKPLLTLLASSDGQRYWTQQHIASISHRLTRYYVRQKHRTCCGLTSAAIAINALTEGDASHLISEENVFQYVQCSNVSVTGPGTSTIDVPELSLGLIQRCGTTLTQLVTLIDSFPDVECVGPTTASNSAVHFTGRSSLEQFIAVLTRSYAPPTATKTNSADDESESETETDEAVVVINYDMSKLGQSYAGHISPVGGYDPVSRQVLILDVCWDGVGPVWCDVGAVWNAMCLTPNEMWKSEGRSGDDPTETVRERGFLVIHRRRRRWRRHRLTSADVCLFAGTASGLTAPIAQLILSYLLATAPL